MTESQQAVRPWQEIIASYQTYASASDVAATWRKHGWVPPSKECAQTMAKQKAFRDWVANPHARPQEPL